jgi:transcriptional regulator with XRE-family HTH domain
MEPTEMGNRLQTLRRTAGLSQFQLAVRANVPVGTIQGWEQGRRRYPRLDVLARVAKVLDITLDELLAEPEPPAPERARRKRK